jgi:capsular exopolysaccharide synthesis family protein
MAQDAAQAWGPGGAKPEFGRSTGVGGFPRGLAPVNDDIEAERGSPVVDLAEYVQVLWKYRVMVLGIFFAVLALGAIYTLLLTPIYRASVTLEIDREASKVLNSPADGLQPQELPTGDEFYQTQYGLLKGRFLAERAVAALHLGDDPAALKLLGWHPPTFKSAQSAEDQRAARYRDAVSLVEKHITVAPVRASRLVRIEFDSRDPNFSSRVANTLAENFITANLARRFEAASYAREFLEQHLAEEKQKLEASERAAVAYAAQQQIIAIPIPQANGAPPTAVTESLVASNLSTLNGDLAVATNQRVLAEQHWRQAQTTPGANLPEVLADPTFQKLQQDRAKAAADYQQKLATYKPDHPTMRELKGQLTDLDRSIAAQISSTQKSIENQYETSVNQEKSLQIKVNQLKQAMIDLNNRSIQYNILQRDVDTNRTLYDGLLQCYKEVGIAGGVGTNNISIVDRALAPRKPAVPNVPLYLAVSAAVGLILGLGTAFVLDALDQGVNAPADIEARLHLPLMGMVPITARGVTPAQALSDPRSAISESVNAIRTALQFSTSDGVPRTLLVTSSRSEEGKTTTAASLATSFARLGGRVLLVDGDLRNPSLHRLLGVKNTTGLSRFLSGSASFEQVVQKAGEGSLSVVACGPLPPNPSELLAGPGLSVFLQQASDAFDLVIIDGPPVVGLSDAVSLAAAAVATLFVVEAVKVRRAAAREAIRRLEAVDARIVGAVLCKFDARNAAYGYEYSYHYAYGDRGARPAA